MNHANLLRKIDRLYNELIGPDILNYNGSQNKAEFYDCIEYLDRHIGKMDDKEIWFLEIGAYKGLWALAFNILCAENQKIPKYYNTPQKLDRVTWCMVGCHKEERGGNYGRKHTQES
jgi:hypothetical protein